MTKEKEAVSRKRYQHLRVPVFPDEKEIIEKSARDAGLSVAAFLRSVGQGYEVKGITDYENVRELARINGDLGRLGGLLKLWLVGDARTASISDSTIKALLGRIEENQDKLGALMGEIVRPRSSK